MKGRIILITVALMLLAALIYVSGPAKIAGILLRTNLFIAAIGFGLWFVGALFRTKRWTFLMKPAGITVPFRTALKVYIAGLFISNITPAKSGDPIRSILLKKTAGDRVSNSLPSIILERLLDVGAMVIIGAVGLLMLAVSSSSEFVFWFIAAIAVYSAAFAIAMFILYSEGRVRWAVRTFGGIASKLPRIKNYVGRMEEFALNMQKSLSQYNNKKVIILGLLYSIIVWLIEGIIVYVAFLSLGFEVPIVAAVTAMSVITLISFLTFLPGGIGSAEIIMIAFLTSVTTLTMADIMAAAIVMRVLSYWVYVILGAFLLTTMKYEHKI